MDRWNQLDHKTTAKSRSDFFHVLFLKIIPIQLLCQILTGHRFTGAGLQNCSEILDRHILSFENYLYLFAKSQFHKNSIFKSTEGSGCRKTLYGHYTIKKQKRKTELLSEKR